MIDEINISNFKQIIKADLSLSYINVLVGANNSGENCILQAIHFGIMLAQARRISGFEQFPTIASDGAQLREGLLDKTNTASSVWPDIAYRSKANDDFMEKQGFVSKVHRKKPHLKRTPRHIQKSNAGKSVIRSRVEHVVPIRNHRPGCSSEQSVSPGPR